MYFCPDTAVISIDDSKPRSTTGAAAPRLMATNSAFAEKRALSRPYALLIVQRQSGQPPERRDNAARAITEAYGRFKNGSRD
jgi:hypothetical protein